MMPRVHVVALMMAALLLSACLGDMPSSGQIGYGREISTAADSNFVRTIVSPPQPGADPVGIVRGFMAAAAGDTGTFATARLFLAPEVREEWRPLSEIRVVTDRAMEWDSDNVRSPGVVRFTSTRVATINAQGEYRMDEGTYGADFWLRLVNQEWRIARFPDGLTLSKSELGRSYRSVAIYFLDRSRSVVVPNQVYLPVRPALATSMIRALLNGPSPWLSPAVRSAFPEGTILQVDAVPIVDGVASVDLSEQAARASSSDRTLLSAQIVHTLRQITEVRSVRITAGGVPLSVPGMDRTQPISSWSALAPDVANTDPLLYFSASEGLAALPVGIGATEPEPFRSRLQQDIEGLRWPSVALERDRVVAIDAAGNVVTGAVAQTAGGQVSIGSLEIALPVQVQPFMRPRWDVTATYWAAVSGTKSLSVYAGRLGAEPVRVETPSWGTGTVSAFAISREGTRAVVARTSGSRSDVYLLRVVRSGRENDGRIRLEEPIKIAAIAGTVSDIGWASASQVIALGGQLGLARQVWALSIDGSPATPIGPPIAAVSIAVAPGHMPVAETLDRRLFILRDQRWTELTSGRDPSYSG